MSMQVPMTMSETVVRVIPGRMDAIAAVYDECQPDLFGYAASLTRDLAAAEDVVQESFTRLIREHAAGRSPDNPRAWLYRVCTNLAFSRSRRRLIADRWHRLFGQHQHEDVDEAAEDTVIRRERHTELSAALATLPADHRAALLLAADGFSGREIATILDKTEGATRNILWRARLTLKDRLQDGDLR
jgi:RNA polymerase sigma-70 factor (ECF subfamily)